MLRRTALASLAAGVATVAARPAMAQAYPSKPINLIVPFAAGGPTDLMARIFGERMGRELGQQFIIDNVTGAAGSIAVGKAARAAPDGYTIQIGHVGTNVANGIIYKNLTYNLLTDLVPIARLPQNPMLVVSSNQVAAKDLKELVAWLKANPGQALLGTAGAGSASNLAGAFFEKQTGTAFHRVPYRGLGLAMQDLMAGRIDLIIDLAANALPQVRAGTVKAYAVTSPARLAVAPDIPTVDEAGLPGLHMAVWQAVWAPKGTPQPAIDRLNAAVVDALADPRARQRLIELGQDIFPRDQQTPAGLRALHQADIEKWWPIVKAANIKAE
jgi:tripartite-type tricarboxylate transporter receptor subunit TctC